MWLKELKYYDELTSLKKKWRFWKSLFKILTFEFASMSILEIIVISMIVGAGVHYIKDIFQADYEKRLTEKVVSLDKCQQDLRKQSEQSAYDKVKISDTTNILLALQDYSFDEGILPASLEELIIDKYLGSNLNDPEFRRPYYYKKLSAAEFVFCVYLSTGVWGTNMDQCPTKEAFLTEKIMESIKIITVSDVADSRLRVRREASLDAEILLKVSSGEKFEVLEEKDQWIKIKLKQPIKLRDETFDSGWVWKEYVGE